MLGRSGGLEPEFALMYNRKTESLHGEEEKVYKIVCETVRDYCNVKNIDINSDFELPEYFITSHEIPYLDRIKTQSVIQKFIDTAISSTVNLPHEATVEDVEKLYLRAWKEKLKGITIFRDGCARLGILTTGETEEAEENKLPRGYVIDVDDNVVGKYRKIVSGCGSLHIQAYFDKDNGELLQTYLSKGSTGGCNNFMIGLSRMISLAARGGVPMNYILDQLKSTGACPSYAVRSATKKDTSRGACCPMAIGNMLKEMYEEMQKELGQETIKKEIKKPQQEKEKKLPQETEDKPFNVCPECGAKLEMTGGCNSCLSCGFSSCS